MSKAHDVGAGQNFQVEVTFDQPNCEGPTTFLQTTESACFRPDPVCTDVGGGQSQLTGCVANPAPYLVSLVKPYILIQLWSRTNEGCKLNPVGRTFVTQGRCVITAPGVSIDYSCVRTETNSSLIYNVHTSSIDCSGTPAVAGSFVSDGTTCNPASVISAPAIVACDQTSDRFCRAASLSVSLVLSALLILAALM